MGKHKGRILNHWGNLKPIYSCNNIHYSTLLYYYYKSYYNDINVNEKFAGTYPVCKQAVTY